MPKVSHAHPQENVTGKPLCSLYSDLAFLQVDACLKGLVAQASSSRLPKVSHAHPQENVTEKALVLTFLRFGILTRCLCMTEFICALGVWPAPFVPTVRTHLLILFWAFGWLSHTNPFAS